MADSTAPPQRILDAAARVVAEQGLVALSMRRVARAAGVSLAQVQYYFHTKADLVGGVFERSTQQFLGSVETLLAGDPSARRLRTLVWNWLPLDAAREPWARIWLEFTAAALGDATLAATSARVDEQLRTWLTAEIRGLAASGQLRIPVDAPAAAAQLLALVDGTTAHCLVLPFGERERFAERCIGTWLDILTHRDPEEDQS